MAISKTKLKKLAVQKILSTGDREYIERASEMLGVDFVRTNCADCFRDQCHVLLRIIAERAAAEHLPSNRELFLRPGLDVLLNGVRINAATMNSDEKIEQILKEGLPRKFVLTREEMNARYGYK